MTPLTAGAALAAAGAIFFAVHGVTRAATRGRRLTAERLARQAASLGSTPSAGASGGTALRHQGRLDRRLSEAPIAASWRHDLDRAGLPWQNNDYLAVILVSAALLGLVAVLATGSAIAAVAAMLLGAAMPVVYVKRRVTRRMTLLNTQVADAIDLVTASLRSGFGFVQSLELAAREQPDPIAGELSRALQEMGLGMSADEALERMVARTGDSDLDLVVTAVLIQRRVGGNLAEVLGNISHMIRERVRVRGEIRTLTAQARLSSWIVGLLPVGLAAAMTAMQPDYMSILWTEPAGRVLVGVAVALELLGFYLVRRIAKIDY